MSNTFYYNRYNNDNENVIYYNRFNNNKPYYNSNNNNEKNVNEFTEEDLNALEVNVDRLVNLVRKFPGNEKLPGNLQLPMKEGQKYKTVAEPRKAFGKLPAHLQGGRKRKTKKQKRKMRKTRSRKN